MVAAINPDAPGFTVHRGILKTAAYDLTQT